ncbi:unnamed protein product [Caenorhabditis auriculariae]|uniref:HORMA domain-containing protein n=1 Tax=Caenorhabditis auriculariae TaxID=2777116 RepID=A0A8S1GXK5_9PELO|nr:unnamed protein product [Caenorhabditis auriculariae]
MPPAVSQVSHSQDSIQNISRRISNGDAVHDTKWTQTFPASVGDEVNSHRFIVRAVFLAFSSILRYRKILPEDCFRTNYITESVKVKSLDYKNGLGGRVAAKIRGASEAIKAGYLDEFSLVIYLDEENDDDAAEVFTWKMFYDDGIPYAELSSGNVGGTSLQRLASLKFEGSQKVCHQFVLMIRSIVLMCAKILKPLPEKAMASFRIKYRDHTPGDYKADGFLDHPTYFNVPEGIQSATVGNLRPGFHGSILTCCSLFMEDGFAAESQLKKAIDSYAETNGFGVNDTSYQSFTATNEISGMDTPPLIEKPRTAEEDEPMETESMGSHPSKRSKKSSEPPAKTQQPKRATRARTQTAKIEKKAKISPKKNQRHYGRVSSVQVASP